MLGGFSLGTLVGTMIALPPGCTVTYAVWADVDKLTNERISGMTCVAENNLYTM
jgi:hypothetical protein